LVNGIAVTLDWNDLRYFLAVAREGSTLAAGRTLRVSQTTVARRVAALENAIGFPLFDKRQAGYVLNDVGQDLIERAEQVELAARQFEDSASGRSREISGTVCLTTHEMIAVTLLVPILRELHERYPEIVIQIDTREQLLDLGAGEADIALRSTTATEQPAGIVGRRICLDDWTLYCSREYAEKHAFRRLATTCSRTPSSEVEGPLYGGNIWLGSANSAWRIMSQSITRRPTACWPASALDLE